MPKSSPTARAVNACLETELLLCCARTRMDAESTLRLQALLRTDIDWERLLHRASKHQVIPLLYRSLATTWPEAVPKAILEQLRNDCRVNIIHNHVLAGELLTLLHVLEGHGIPVIPYKGPTLAVSVYGDLTLRQFCDLDLLVHERDFVRTTTLLLAQGFQQRHAFDWESSFVHESSSVWVDLHRGIVPQSFHFPLDFERLWKYRTPVSLAGTTVSTLAPEDMLIVLCVQQAKDKWVLLHKSFKDRDHGLLQLCDIAELLRVYQNMDWGRVMHEARRGGGQRMLLFGLCLARNLLGITLPKDVAQKLQAHASVRALAAHVQERFFHATDDSCSAPLTQARFHFAVRERMRDKVYPYLLSGASRILPNEKDRAVLPLPVCLSWLYYLIRPIRLIREYGLRPVWRRLKHLVVYLHHADN